MKWLVTAGGLLAVAAFLSMVEPPSPIGLSRSGSSVWPPPHYTANGFRNPWGQERQVRFRDFLRWRRERRADPPPRYRDVVGALPLAEPDWTRIAHPGDSLVVTWIGHASFLLQLGGLNILTDPIFSERGSPVQFAGPRRVTALPFDPNQLPEIDLVLISHNHYDHLDRAAVRCLGNAPVWFVPLGLKPWFARQGVTNVVELDWWAKAEVSGGGLVTCVPSRHFSSRTLWDRNRTLWAGWVVAAGGHRVYFAGDTGYGPHFAAIGTRTGLPDLALLPIGAYRPEWFMSPVHINPAEAIQAHLDVGAKRTVGMHWGTFIMSDEPFLEPPRLFSAAARQAGLDDEETLVLTHGQTLVLP